MSKFLIEAMPGQLHGEVKSQDVTISGTYPTLIPPTPLTDRKDFLVYNGSGETIYFGGIDVTIHNGMPLSNTGVFSMQLGRSEMYAVCTSATVSGIRVLEVV